MKDVDAAADKVCGLSHELFSLLSRKDEQMKCQYYSGKRSCKNLCYRFAQQARESVEAFRIQKRYAALKKTTVEEVGAVRGWVSIYSGVHN